MRTITVEEVISRLTGYLQHELTLDELVGWGAADVRAFGLTWEDCEGFLGRLDCTVRVEVTSA